MSNGHRHSTTMLIKINLDYIDAPLLEQTEAYLYRDCFSHKELTYSKLADAYVLPQKNLKGSRGIGGGIVSVEGEFIESTSLHEGLGCAYPFDKNEVETKNEVAVYIGMIYPIWGHCITDGLKKLWFLRSAEYKSLVQNNKVVLIYTSPDHWNISGNYKEILGSLSINTALLRRIGNIQQYKTIYVPDDSIFIENGHRFFTKEYRETINNIVSSFEIEPQDVYDKVYFTRTNMGSKRDYGEILIEDYLKSRGYKIIAPEKLTFKEELTILQECKTFVSTVGSISHNVLFCKDGTNVVLLRNCADDNGYQPVANNMHNINLTYIDVNLSIFPNVKSPWGGPFFIYVSNNLQRFENDNSELDFPVIAFAQYVCREWLHYILHRAKHFKPGNGNKLLLCTPMGRYYYGEILRMLKSDNMSAQQRLLAYLIKFLLYISK
jgi:hypothetical protein